MSYINKLKLSKNFLSWTVANRPLPTRWSNLQNGVVNRPPTKESIQKKLLFAKAKLTKKYMRTWDEDSGQWQDNRRKGKVKPNPLREPAEKLLKAYLEEFKKQGGTVDQIPMYDKAAYLRQAYITLKIYQKEGVDYLIKLLPAYFEDDFFKKDYWPIWSFLSLKVLNRLKNTYGS